MINSKITSLPEGLKVGGYLTLSHTNVTSLPKGLEVGKNLYLRHTNITSLPKGLKVYGKLHIENALLRKYTDDQLREMVKPGFINGEIFR